MICQFNFLIDRIPSPIFFIIKDFGNQRILKENTKVEILICDLCICDDREKNGDHCADYDD